MGLGWGNKNFFVEELGLTVELTASFDSTFFFNFIVIAVSIYYYYYYLQISAGEVMLYLTICNNMNSRELQYPNITYVNILKSLNHFSVELVESVCLEKSSNHRHLWLLILTHKVTQNLVVFVVLTNSTCD